MFRWLILVAMPLILLGGCGDLEADMQDTRTVSLNMDFHDKHIHAAALLFLHPN